MIGLQPQLNPTQLQVFAYWCVSDRLKKMETSGEKLVGERFYLKTRELSLKNILNEKGFDFESSPVASKSPRKNSLRTLPESVCE